MRFHTLQSIEEKFATDNAMRIRPYTLKVPGEELYLKGKLYNSGTTNYYYERVYPKKRIVLHFTAGNLRSDVMSLTQQNRHVSVPFVIARDGNIYQLFSSKYWSGHLGAGVGNAKGTGNPEDKATIGIELSNYGLLTRKEGNMETIYSRLKNNQSGKIGPTDIYCSVTDSNAYMVTNAPFRGETIFPRYTTLQMDSLIILIRYLTAQYGISRSFLPLDSRFEATPNVLDFNGIVSHVNYRSSGKWDLGTAFNWDALIEGVQALNYESIIPTMRSLESVTTTEPELEMYFPKSRTAVDLTQPEEETTDNEGYNPLDYDM